MWRVPEELSSGRDRALHPAQSAVVQQGEQLPGLTALRWGQRRGGQHPSGEPRPAQERASRGQGGGGEVSSRQRGTGVLVVHHQDGTLSQRCNSQHKRKFAR